MESAQSWHGSAGLTGLEVLAGKGRERRSGKRQKRWEGRGREDMTMHAASLLICEARDACIRSISHDICCICSVFTPCDVL